MPARKRDYAVTSGAQRWLNRRAGDGLPSAPIDIEFTDTTVAGGAVGTVVVAAAGGLTTPYAVGSRIEYDGDGVVRKVTLVDTGTNTVHFAPPLPAASAAGKRVEHFGFGIAESHFDAVSVAGIQLWLGKSGLPTWSVPSSGASPPTAATLRLGSAVQFVVAVFDKNGKGRWTSVSQLLAARPRFKFTWLVGAGLTPDANKVGLYTAAVVGATTAQAKLSLNGVDFDSQVIAVTIV
jgi:hypothetical protein